MALLDGPGIGPGTGPEATGPGGGGPAGEPFHAVERELALLFRRGRARTQEMAREVHPDLEGSSYALLGHVERAGPVRVTDLGAYFGVGKATMSRQIKALEALGLIRRGSDPLDGRVSLVSVTEEGRRRVVRAREARRERIRNLMATWEPGDVAAFARLLGRFNDLMADLHGPAPGRD